MQINRKNNILPAKRRVALLPFIIVLVLFVCTLPVYAAAPKVKKITWTHKESTVYVGLNSSKKKKLKVTISPKKARSRKLVWSSSNKKVATVGKTGKIYPKKIGKTKITCKISSQPKKKIKCTIYVVKPSKKITMKTEGKTLEIGQTYRRSAKLSPANATVKNMIWSSSNTRVAVVSKDGTVTAKGAGSAVITVSAKDGFSKSRSYQVKVLKSLKNQAKFIAHRGLSSRAPENTLKAFQLAGEAGFWGAETDVRKSKDGKFILLHDDTLNRMCGIDRSPEEMTLAEIKNARIISGNGLKQYKTETSATTIPTLEEYLQACKKYRLVPVIEIKMNYNWDDEAELTAQSVTQEEEEHAAQDITQEEELLKELQDDAKATEPVLEDDTEMKLQSVAEDDLVNLFSTVKSVMGNSKVVFIGFDLQAILKLREIANAMGDSSAVELQHLVGSVDLNNLDLYKKYNIGLDANYNATNVITAEKVVKAGIPMNMWTVNDSSKIREYVSKGIPYITTDCLWW